MSVQNLCFDRLFNKKNDIFFKSDHSADVGYKYAFCFKKMIIAR